MARLLLLNGAPGSGKSTLARMYAENHPLTLALDLDVLRSMLGGWSDHPQQAGVITRAMAIEAARVQLGAGRDVIVPQYLARLEFVLELEQLSRGTGAEFVEVLLTGDPGEFARRFARRAADPRDPAHADAPRLLAGDGGATAFRDIQDRLSAVVSARPRTVALESDGEVEATYAALRAAVGTGIWRAPADRRITTARTLLAPLSVDDADEMTGVLSAPELYAFIGGEPPDAAGLRSRYQRLVLGRSDDGRQDWFNWVIRRLDDGRAVGTVQATVMDGGARADVAWVVGLPWQGQGYASEAARALVYWLADAGVPHITAHVHPDHTASGAVARHAGLGPTGTIVDGEQRWAWSRPPSPPAPDDLPPPPPPGDHPPPLIQ